MTLGTQSSTDLIIDSPPVVAHNDFLTLVVAGDEYPIPATFDLSGVPTEHHAGAVLAIHSYARRVAIGG